MNTDIYEAMAILLKSLIDRGFNHVFVNDVRVVFVNRENETQYTPFKERQRTIKAIYKNLFDEETKYAISTSEFLYRVQERIKDENTNVAIKLTMSKHAAKKLEKIAYQHDDTLHSFIAGILEDFAKCYGGE